MKKCTKLGFLLQSQHRNTSVILLESNTGKNYWSPYFPHIMTNLTTKYYQFFPQKPEEKKNDRRKGYRHTMKSVPSVRPRYKFSTNLIIFCLQSIRWPKFFRLFFSINRTENKSLLHYCILLLYSTNFGVQLLDKQSTISGNTVYPFQNQVTQTIALNWSVQDIKLISLKLWHMFVQNVNHYSRKFEKNMNLTRKIFLKYWWRSEVGIYQKKLPTGWTLSVGIELFIKKVLKVRK